MFPSKAIAILSMLVLLNVCQLTVSEMIKRSEWQAETASGALDNLELPAKRIIIAHTATNHCGTKDACTSKVQIIQIFHMTMSGFFDIGYNFLIGGDGNTYEGRGWDFQGAHTRGFNKGSIGIAFIGSFDTFTPPEDQLDAAKKLIEEGVRLGKLDKDYKLYGQRQLTNVQSPRDNLYDIIQQWPHWSIYNSTEPSF